MRIPLPSWQTTGRLSFEPIGREHAAELQDALCDPRVYEFISAGAPTPAELECSFARKAAGVPAHRSDEKWVDFAVRLLETRQTIGRLEATLIGTRAEVAYLFGAAWWGHGYATEGLEWLHRLMSDSFSIAEFWATVLPGNIRSVNLLERTGYYEAAPETWPRLLSYDPGDRVFHKSIQTEFP